eukprot:m.84483 g.84483  ORF g.84483 m.84483 type:complete len:149 (-) comp14688_c0_seq2:2100-2546(-)
MPRLVMSHPAGAARAAAGATAPVEAEGLPSSRSHDDSSVCDHDDDDDDEGQPTKKRAKQQAPVCEADLLAARQHLEEAARNAPKPSTAGVPQQQPHASQFSHFRAQASQATYTTHQVHASQMTHSACLRHLNDQIRKITSAQPKHQDS